ncbi:gcn5-related n-acetyltransferase [Flagelloscypha sp. PMI_526]|nr:gcn5-related n-acetyltransferase [Flagelloscypha sp. PMI_526]
MSSGRPVGPVVSNHAAPYPERKTLTGKHVILEPLRSSHAEALVPLFTGSENDYLWDYMFDGPFSSSQSQEFRALVAKYETSTDPFLFAVIHPETSEPIGWISFLRIDTSNRSIEVGNVLFSSKLQRTTGATEAFYLLGCYVFEELGYRRYEWKCNDLNAPSKRSALRLGFTAEGVFRQHMIVKGRNRDTAWFAMVDDEWPARKKAMEAWLDPSNFDAEGKQKKKLEDFMLSSVQLGIDGSGALANAMKALLTV